LVPPARRYAGIVPNAHRFLLILPGRVGPEAAFSPRAALQAMVSQRRWQEAG
jgi:hypothetical protein